MNTQSLSKTYTVLPLTENDADAVFELCRKNELFYRYHPPFVTVQSILDDMRALPPGKAISDKLYAGYFNDGNLIAVIDLIFGYPDESTAFIGFIMVDVSVQGKGIGSVIIAELTECIRSLGYNRLRLAVDKGNPQSERFWIKNGFSFDLIAQKNGCSAYLPMDRML